MRYLVERSGPLIRIRVPEGATDETLDGESLYSQVEALLRDPTHPTSLVLHDLRGTPRSPVRRKRFAAWIEANDPLIRSRIEAYACVAGSAMLQGMVTAVLWLVDPPIPWKAFSDPESAEAWLLARAPGRG